MLNKMISTGKVRNEFENEFVDLEKREQKNALKDIKAFFKSIKQKNVDQPNEEETTQKIIDLWLLANCYKGRGRSVDKACQWIENPLGLFVEKDEKKEFFIKCLVNALETCNLINYKNDNEFREGTVVLRINNKPQVKSFLTNIKRIFEIKTLVETSEVYTVQKLIQQQGYREYGMAEDIDYPEVLNFAPLTLANTFEDLSTQDQELIPFGHEEEDAPLLS